MNKKDIPKLLHQTKKTTKQDGIIAETRKPLKEPTKKKRKWRPTFAKSGGPEAGSHH